MSDTGNDFWGSPLFSQDRNAKHWRKNIQIKKKDQKKTNQKTNQKDSHKIITDQTQDLSSSTA